VGELIFIIADERDHGFYRTLSFGNKRAEIYSLKNLCDCMKDCRADIILLDCNYELETGLKSLKNIKAVSPTIPVIFLADISFEELILKAFKNGARDFFKKPVSIPELQDTVKGLLKIRRKSKETRSGFMKIRGVDPKKLFRKKTQLQSVNLYKAIRFIEENLSHVIHLDRVAEEANIGRYHFCRIFKKRVGISPMRLVSYMRIEKAKKLLEKAELTISDVASYSGFNDTSSFIKQFKKITGLTPAGYRKSLI
jgi:YesN/AraC family two-component response regulator